MDLEFYRYSNNSWDTIYENGYIANYPNDHVIKFIFNNFSRIPNKNNVKILDLGCGGGNNIWMLAREGYDVYGFDGSMKALELAKKRLDEETLKAGIKQGNFLDLPYEHDFFDAVIDDAAIESNIIRDIKLIFKQVYNVLSGRGRYHGMLISSDSKSSMVGSEIEKNTFADTTGAFINRKRTIHFFDEPELRTILDEVGFLNIEINYFITTKNNSKDFIKFLLVDATK